MTVSISNSRHRSSQSLASLNSLAKATSPPHQGPSNDTTAPSEKARNTASSESRTVMATHVVVNGKTTTTTRRRARSSLGGGSAEDLAKSFQIDQVPTFPAEGRKFTSKTCRAPRPNKHIAGSAPASPRPQQSSVSKHPHHPGDERLASLGNLGGGAASLYMFSKTAPERSFSNKTAAAKAAAILVTEAASKLQPTVAASGCPNSTCREDERVGASEQFESGQERDDQEPSPGQRTDQHSRGREMCNPLKAGSNIQSIDEELAEDSSTLQILEQNMQQDIDVGVAVENIVYKQPPEMWSNPASPDASSVVSDRQSADRKLGNLSETSSVGGLPNLFMESGKFNAEHAKPVRENEPVSSCLAPERSLCNKESQSPALGLGLEVSATATGGKTLVPFLNPSLSPSKLSSTELNNVAACEHESKPNANLSAMLGALDRDKSHRELQWSSKITVENTASTPQDLVNMVVSNSLSAPSLEMFSAPGADGKPRVISMIISSSTPGNLPSRSASSVGVERCVLPRGDQKPCLTLAHGDREAKPATEAVASFPVEKVTEEELTEAAFLSSVGWSKDSIPGEDYLEDACQHSPVISRGNRSNKCMQEIQCISDVATREHFVEAKHFSSVGCTNSEAGVYEKGPAVESGSSVASRISNTCPDNRVQVPADVIQWNKIRVKNLSRKFPGMTAVGKSGQNVLFRKQPMLDTSLVNFSETLSFPTDKPVHYNLDLHPEKENAESRHNCEVQRNRDVAGVLAPGFQAFAAAQMTKKSDQSEDLYGGLAKQGCQSKKAGYINLSNGTGILTSRSVCKPAPRLVLGSRTVAEAYEKAPPPPPTPPHQQSSNSMPMLQLYPLEVYHEAPTSFSLLGNPSFSSSHQDRIWEEQAEAYSSGGRGSPAHEDYGPGVFQCASSIVGAISSVESLHSASGSLRKHPLDWTLTISPSTLAAAAATADETCGSSHDGRNSKRNGRPRTPLRTLLAQDNNGKVSGNNDIANRSRPLSNPKRHIWSSCICCSHCVN